RWTESLALPLSTYGLTPGDEIKLFVRVLDNDPAGPKGSESSIAVVRIIAQEEFERLARTRHSLEMLQSKYQQAQRRLESLADDVDRLQKKMKEHAADALADKQQREEMQRLTKRIQEEAEALRR